MTAAFNPGSPRCPAASPVPEEWPEELAHLGFEAAGAPGVAEATVEAGLAQGALLNWLFVDLNSYFASVEQEARPELRGRPVGVIPFETSAAYSTVVIACSKEAKAAGCKNVMRVPEALALCPDLVLVTQRPDLFRRGHGLEQKLDVRMVTQQERKNVGEDLSLRARNHTQ